MKKETEKDRYTQLHAQQIEINTKYGFKRIEQSDSSSSQYRILGFIYCRLLGNRLILKPGI